MTDFDHPWKEALDEFLKEFLELCFPWIHDAIDWSVPYEPLPQELQKLVFDGETSNQTVDRLYKVRMKDGIDEVLHLHIEVQCQYDADLGRRMYVYHYRLFDKCGTLPVSIVVFGDDSPSWRPSSFERERLGCGIAFRYNTVKLLDFRARIGELETSENLFAPFILAHLRTLETRKDDKARGEAKFRLLRDLIDRGMDKPRIRRLFRLIEWLMAVPKELNLQLNRELGAYAMQNKKPFVTPMEELWLEERELKGRCLGRIHQAERFLSKMMTPADNLIALDVPELEAMADQLEAEMFNKRISD